VVPYARAHPLIAVVPLTVLVAANCSFITLDWCGLAGLVPAAAPRLPTSPDTSQPSVWLEVSLSKRRGPTMVGIIPHLKDEGFGPIDIEAMSKALDDVCTALKIDGGDTATREVIAIRLIELANHGERNSEKLRDRLLLEANSGTGL
jgi:hypothetical protein